MRWPLVTTRIEVEEDVVGARQRAKSIAAELDFSLEDQIRIATAVSEIARNAYGYAGGGRVQYGIDDGEGRQAFKITISDKGPGVGDLKTILEGRYVSPTGLGLGIIGARRLMDTFDIISDANGTAVELGKTLPDRVGPFDGKRALDLAKQIAGSGTSDPNAVMREQNRELLQSLATLAEREEETRRLNRELEETNRGVVALYADLELKADELRVAGETLEAKVVTRTAELALTNSLLKAEAEARERISEELRQAQKMEAVGQLTGGIAHDFNNLLTGIIGSLDMMKRRIKQNKTESLEHYIEVAMASADRASALTHRLLAFARRQPLDPRPTEVNGLIAGMNDMLRRTIKESIILEIRPCCVRCVTLCDPPQLENAILNLAINARDAMPDGGRLVVETSIIPHPAVASPPHGIDQVCIAVSDTGVGMPPDVVARAFDPFFTTKPIGQGTGLGLSMIHGFAHQSGGRARIKSEVGRGTTIEIMLPRFAGDGTMVEKLDVAPAAEAKGEFILVVEDEAMVRALVVDALREAGYCVKEAFDGADGLKQLNLPGRIDLVVSDVGLPGLNGRQMADAARVTRPEIRFLFTTGYAEGAAMTEDCLAPGMSLLTKPFAIEALLLKVREAIER